MSIKLINKYTLISLFFFSLIFPTIALGTPIKIMSYNLGKPKATKILVPWQSRVSLIIDIINKQNPDIIGLQEVHSQLQLNDLLESYRGVYTFFVTPTYINRAQYQRSNNIIMFKARRFNKIKSGTLPHTEELKKIYKTPVWVTLEDRYKKNKRLTFINAHLDSRKTSTYRPASAKIIRNFASRQNNPVVAVGDFNCEPWDDDTINIMTEKSYKGKSFNDLLCHSNDISQCWNPTFYWGTKLDYIFATQEIKSSAISHPYIVGDEKEFVIFEGDLTMSLPSDHFAVGVSITL